jgi:ABC-type transport system involved in multi-copper enzyme maturation permease subunit
MALRAPINPVFELERRQLSRRRRVYAGRCLVATVILLLFLSFASRAGFFVNMKAGHDISLVVRTFLLDLVWLAFAFVVVMSPAVGAGAVCRDKGRGVLEHMLVTDLTTAEIVVGKLAARLGAVLGVIACGLPVVVLMTVSGGVAPEEILKAVLVIAGTAFLAGSLAVTISVWAKRAREALIETYAILALWFLAALILRVIRKPFAPWATGWTEWIDPFWLMGLLVNRPDAVGLGDCAAFFTLATMTSAWLLRRGASRLRAVAARQADQPARVAPARRAPRWLGRQLRRLPGPSLDGNPVLWREWHRQTSRRMVFLWGVYACIATALTIFAIAEIAWSPTDNHVLIGIPLAGFLVGIGMLMLCTRAAGSLAEERERSSLDLLLATPLSSGAILRGKWWGVYRRFPPLALLPTLIVVSLAVNSGRWGLARLVILLILAQGASLTSIGLALAIWVRRPGQAVVISALFYLLLAVGWLVLIAALAPSGSALGMAVASPLYGPMYLCGGVAADRYWTAGDCWFWGRFWLVVHTAASVGLFLAAHSAFDRRLGRMPDTSGRFLRSTPKQAPHKARPEAKHDRMMASRQSAARFHRGGRFPIIKSLMARGRRTLGFDERRVPVGDEVRQRWSS